MGLYKDKIYYSVFGAFVFNRLYHYILYDDKKIKEMLPFKFVLFVLISNFFSLYFPLYAGFLLVYGAVFPYSILPGFLGEHAPQFINFDDLYLYTVFKNG
jgi:hypothetical protein